MIDGEKARKRAEELHHRLSGADKREASTPEDVERALQRAAEARERSRNAHLSAVLINRQTTLDAYLSQSHHISVCIIQIPSNPTHISRHASQSINHGTARATTTVAVSSWIGRSPSSNGGRSTTTVSVFDSVDRGT
jgi:hypothetical protein